MAPSSSRTPGRSRRSMPARALPRWRVALDATISAPLMVQGGWLLAATDRGDVIMLRSATGEVMWRQGVGAAVRVRPVAAGRQVYVALEDGRVFALALNSGARIWEARLPGRATTLHPLDDRVFVGCADRFFYCLSAGSGKTNWKWRTGGTIVGTTAVDDRTRVLRRPRQCTPRARSVERQPEMESLSPESPDRRAAPHRALPARSPALRRKSPRSTWWTVGLRARSSWPVNRSIPPRSYPPPEVDPGG